jgi:mycofactocin precursor
MSMSVNAEELRSENMEVEVKEECAEDPLILEEIIIEELAVDGICGIY